MNSEVSSGVRIRRGYIRAGGQIHFRQAGPEGARSPLVLLHPAPGSGAVFETFMAEMGRDRLVVAPDLPGHGMSDALPAPPQIADYANAVLAFEATLGLGLFDVMGYHLGSLVAAEMARLQPAAVRKVIMIAAPMFTDDDKAKLGTRAAPSIAEQAAGFANGWTAFSTQFWKMGNDPAQAWNLYLEAQRQPPAWLPAHNAVMDYDFAAALPEVTQPVLVLNADDELKEQTRRAGPLLKNGRIHDLPGWSHGFLDSKAAETASLVRAFLDG